ncbi:6554_t:CDS:1 [Cetraspora pellucida]|uniref:6554_t:CDS:1 n=1 Tax=Cetraspora pellucida TaxID=1433469 RepID=A0A9N9A9K5_9GLOM|nr:6554_t:CDS:1 [Cetraspora pellucida]
MTEAEPPINPVSNGNEFTSTDIERLYSRIQAVIQPPKSSISPRQVTPFDNMSPVRSQSPEPFNDEAEEKIEPQLPEVSDAIFVEATNQKENERDGTEGNSIDCHCQSIKVTSGTAICSDCGRNIPILAHLNRERLQSIDDLEVANNRIKEEFDKAERQNDEIHNLQKRIIELEDKIDLKTDELNSKTKELNSKTEELNFKSEELNSLKEDMASLNDKYVDEIEKVAELQHSKDMVENELEDLTQKLFERANELVASEAKQRHELQLQHNILKKQLEETQGRLTAESSQLMELREKMEQMVQQQSQMTESERLSFSDPLFRASIDFAELFGLREKSPEAAATLPGPTGVDGIGIDADLIAEFKDFVEQSSTVRLQKIHTIPFMRHCLEEDVTPCMRFGNNPRVFSSKIVEAIVANTCFIEEAPPGADREQALNPNSPIRASAARPMLWDRAFGNSSATRIGCQCCGRAGPLAFRYRITNLDDWSLIDRYCRDRMVAVCEFYVFTRNVRQGLYNNRSISDLYAECLRLRLQMFYARLGALPSMLSSLGIKGTELASAKKPTYILPEMEESPVLVVSDDASGTLYNDQKDFVSVSPPPRESPPPDTSDNK